MSRYYVQRGEFSVRVMDSHGRSLDNAPLAVDYFRTRSSAERACKMLNAGLATVDHHAVSGCKVREIIEPAVVQPLFGADAFSQMRGQMAFGGDDGR